MATLHMEVESARTIHSNITIAHSSIQEILINLYRGVDSVVDNSWQGNSAEEFKNEFIEWSEGQKQLLENLNVLSIRLQNEINEWEQMAASLN